MTPQSKYRDKYYFKKTFSQISQAFKTYILSHSSNFLMNLRNQQNENSVAFYCNYDPVIKVDKQKLLDKYDYLCTMFKRWFKHYKSDLIGI